ncbi:DUF2141 domain-containing protein [Tenacibaculum insulae]|uniref:DUF2141 domain-containing protein n=1 Tax=Tenacibaculum insulae TaxID=2029677 RepID=UPI003AB2E973
MQKSIITLLIILSGITSVFSQEKHTITLNFEGIKSNKGDVFVAVYNTKESFLKTPFKKATVKVIGKKAMVVFNDVRSGIYAISVYHDANDNKKMDTNFLGIPKEPVGISNNAKAFMGPPKYKDAKFNVTKNIKLKINIK